MERTLNRSSSLWQDTMLREGVVKINTFHSFSCPSEFLPVPTLTESEWKPKDEEALVRQASQVCLFEYRIGYTEGRRFWREEREKEIQHTQPA